MDSPFDDVSIRLRLEAGGDEMEFRALTNVKADIFIDDGTYKIGKIRAWLIHRHRIPAGYFYSAFDGHSQTCHWLGCELMEPRFGRIRLESLAPYDDHKSGFMIVHKFDITDHCKSRHSSDIQTAALWKFLHHRSVVKTVSTFVHVLEPDFDRQDANAFLRNGFFQDPAIALEGGDSQRILVASSKHTKMPLKSHRTAAAIQFVSIPEFEQPKGIDLELFHYVKEECPRPDDRVNSAMPDTIANDIDQFLRKGASIRRSTALMAAVAKDWFPLVKYLLKKDPSALNWGDHNGWTPLMMSAATAAGRSPKNGIAQTIVLDYLLSNGADKSTQDKKGMTAYGHFVKMKLYYKEMIDSMAGNRMRAISPANYIAPTTSERLIQSKLLPPNGQSASDKRGGERAGIIVFDDDNKIVHENVSDDESSYGDYSEEEDYDPCWESRAWDRMINPYPF